MKDKCMLMVYSPIIHIPKSKSNFLFRIIFTKNIKIFLQLYMIKTDLLTCSQDLVRGGSYLRIS